MLWTKARLIFVKPALNVVIQLIVNDFFKYSSNNRQDRNWPVIVRARLRHLYRWGKWQLILRLSGNTPDSMDLLKRDDSRWAMHFTLSLRNLVGIFPDLLVFSFAT